MKQQDNLLSLSPVENYTPPALPMLADRPELKKLPARWKRNAAVVACAGIMGAALLSGCTNNTTSWRCDGCCDWPHYGGAGAMPMYVVHLTEQESLGVLRTQLETAGLNLSADVPDYSVVIDTHTVGLDLFDAERNTGIALIGDEVSNWQRSEFAQQAAQEFARQTDMPIAVFYSPSEWIDAYCWNEDAPVNEAESQQARVNIEERLTTQVQEFIEFLQAEGILEKEDSHEA